MHVTLILAWACSFFFVLVLMAIAAAERAPINDELDGSPKRLTDAQARPEEAERPAFLPPKPIRRKRAARTPDRVLRGIHEREQARHG